MENQNTNPVETIPAGNEPETKVGEVCSNCGAPLSEGQEFCPKCGTPRKKKPVCGKCGAELAEGQEFCPKCGQKVGLAVDAGVASKIDQFNAGVEKKKGNKKLIPIIAAVAVIAIIIIAVAVKSGGGSKGPDFQKLYDEYCSSTWASVGSDGSYLSLDTNPYDREDDGLAYPAAYTAMGDVNKALGLPDSLIADFGKTTGADGKQSEDFTEQGVSVSWKYHPDKGLEVTYKILKSSK